VKSWILAVAAAVLVGAAFVAVAPSRQPRMVVREVDPEAPPLDDPSGTGQPRHRTGNPLVDALAEERIPSVPNAESYKPLEWRVLRGLNARTGEITPQLKAYEGGNIKLAGYMVPFDDDDERVTQFLLVPIAGQCIHTPPPPANQLIMVEMTSGAKLVDWNRRLSIYGVLEIESTDSPYGPSAFKITAVAARPEAQ
jgi:hypothetical protein